jgi:hypothetical protein
MFNREDFAVEHTSGRYRARHSPIGKMTNPNISGAEAKRPMGQKRNSGAEAKLEWCRSEIQEDNRGIDSRKSIRAGGAEAKSDPATG